MAQIVEFSVGNLNCSCWFHTVLYLLSAVIDVEAKFGLIFELQYDSCKFVCFYHDTMHRAIFLIVWDLGGCDSHFWHALNIVSCVLQGGRKLTHAIPVSIAVNMTTPVSERAELEAERGEEARWRDSAAAPQPVL